MAISDHYPIYLVRKKLKEKRKLTFTEGRTFKNYDKDKFQLDIIADKAWESFWGITNTPDELWGSVYLRITFEGVVLSPSSADSKRSYPICLVGAFPT